MELQKRMESADRRTMGRTESFDIDLAGNLSSIMAQERHDKQRRSQCEYPRSEPVHLPVLFARLLLGYRSWLTPTAKATFALGLCKRSFSMRLRSVQMLKS